MNTTYKTYTERVSTITPTVLGYRLLPYSLGMSINLKAANSKFINGQYNGFLDINNIYRALYCDYMTVMGEFIFAILVCSTTYDEFKEECGSGNIFKARDELFENVSSKYKTQLFNSGSVDNTETKKDNRINVLYEIHKFAHYIHNATTDLPAYNIKETSKSEIESCPFEFEESVIDTLICNTTMTLNECLNRSITETVPVYLMQAHKNQHIEIVGKDLIEQMKAMKGIK